MKNSIILAAVVWLCAGNASSAEENPYSTQINITGKETGPYSIRATVESENQTQPMENSSGSSGKRPYNMDHSRDISDDDLANILSLMSGGGPITDEERQRMKAWIEATKKKSPASQPQPTPGPSPSAGGHPAETAPILDPVQESAPLDAEAAAEDEARHRHLEANINQARKDLQDAQDWLSTATSEADRQQAIRNIEGAKQRLQDATNAAP